MKPMVLAVALITALSACKPTPPPPPAPQPLLVGVFVGDLPCGDCPGMATSLTMVRKGSDWAEGRYLLRQTYRERDVPALVTVGEWTTLRGDANDPDASVYQLDPDKPEHAQYFRKEGEDRIRMLDQESKPLPASLPQVLQLQTTGLPDETKISCLRSGGIPQDAGACALP